jgi:hypothetical protein
MGSGSWERRGQNAPSVPYPEQLPGGSAQRVVKRVGLSQLLIERGQRRLALHDVVLGRDVAEGTDHDWAPGVGVVGTVEAGRDPQPVPIPVDNGNRERAVGVAQ